MKSGYRSTVPLARIRSGIIKSGFCLQAENKTMKSKNKTLFNITILINYIIYLKAINSIRYPIITSVCPLKIWIGEMRIWLQVKFFIQVIKDNIKSPQGDIPDYGISIILP